MFKIAGHWVALGAAYSMASDFVDVMIRSGGQNQTMRYGENSSSSIIASPARKTFISSFLPLSATTQIAINAPDHTKPLAGFPPSSTP
jgi:hypothetical protein